MEILGYMNTRTAILLMSVLLPDVISVLQRFVESLRIKTHVSKVMTGRVYAPALPRFVNASEYLAYSPYWLQIMWWDCSIPTLGSYKCVSLFETPFSGKNRKHFVGRQRVYSNIQPKVRLLYTSSKNKTVLQIALRTLIF